MSEYNSSAINGQPLPALYGSDSRALALYDANVNRGQVDDEIDLAALWRVVLRYKKLIALIFILILSTSTIITKMKRPIYSASALLEINSGGRNLVKFQNLESEDLILTEHLSTQARILSSQAVATEVVKRLNLIADPELGGQLRQRNLSNGIDAIIKMIKQTSDRTYSDEQLTKSAVKRYLSRLSIDPIRKSTLVNVRFKSFDPELSAKVVNEHLQAYIWLSGQRRFDATSGAKQFLETEIANVQSRLSKAQKELTEFARNNGVIDTEDRDNIMLERLATLNQDLAEVQSARIDAETRYLQSESVGSDQLSVVIDDGLIKNLRLQQASLNAEYNELLKIYKPGYPVMLQLQARIDELESSIQAQADNQILALKTKFGQLQSRENRLKSELDEFKNEMLDLQDRAVTYNILKRELDANKQLYEDLLERTKEVGVAAGMELNVASVVDQAMIPSYPSSPNLKSSLMTAGMLGLAIGLGLAFVLALLDNTINDPQQLRKATQLNYLGLVPAIDGRGNSLKIETSALKDEAYRSNVFNTMTHHQPGSIYSEAIQSIRTSLSFSKGADQPKSVMITSATAQEGKSTVAMNLAISYAKSGKKVVVIDADLRRSRYSQVFNVPEAPGLSDYLSRRAPEKFYGVESIKGLSLMVSGGEVSNAVDLLGSQQMHDLIKECEEQFDMVVLDCPPVLGIADAVVLSTVVDELVFVVAANKVSQDAVKDAISRLRTINAPIVGAVLNNMASDSVSDLNYYSPVNRASLQAAS